MLRHAPPSVVHKPEPESRSPKPGPRNPDPILPRGGGTEGRWRSAGDHTHQNAIPAHEVMMKCGTDMQGRKTRDGGGDPCMHHKKAV
jgi:hypothetical protein